MSQVKIEVNETAIVTGEVIRSTALESEAPQKRKARNRVKRKSPGKKTRK